MKKRTWVLPGQLLSVYFLNARQGWMMVTSDNPELNQVLYTQDGGGTWNKVSEVAWKQAQFEFVNERSVGRSQGMALPPHSSAPKMAAKSGYR